MRTSQTRGRPQSRASGQYLECLRARQQFLQAQKAARRPAVRASISVALARLDTAIGTLERRTAGKPDIDRQLQVERGHCDFVGAVSPLRAFMSPEGD